MKPGMSAKLTFSQYRIIPVSGAARMRPGSVADANAGGTKAAKGAGEIVVVVEEVFIRGKRRVSSS